MVKRLIWSNESLEDIDSIAEFISRDSMYYAQHVVEQILSLGESIVEQPSAGRVVPELKKGDIRERFVYSYRVIYRVGESDINVLAVIHGRRLLESVDSRF